MKARSTRTFIFENHRDTMSNRNRDTDIMQFDDKCLCMSNKTKNKDSVQLNELEEQSGNVQLQ